MKQIADKNTFATTEGYRHFAPPQAKPAQSKNLLLAAAAAAAPDYWCLIRSFLQNLLKITYAAGAKLLQLLHKYQSPKTKN